MPNAVGRVSIGDSVQSENKVEMAREVFNLAMVVDTAAQRWGERVVLHHYETGRAVTYREAAEMMNRVGNALRGSGIEIENRVAILLDDSPEWAYAFWGALKIGAVATPLNTLLTEKDYAFFLGDSRAKVLFVGASHFDKIEGILSSLPYLKRVIVCTGSGFRGGGGRVVDWETFIQGAAKELEVEPTFTTDLAWFVYTSGSTGRPRAIMRCHGNRSRTRSIEEVYGLGEGDIQFHIAKLYFQTSFAIGLIGAFGSGSSTVLLSGRPTPLTVLEVIARYRPTFLSGPPTIFARMVDAAKEAPHLADLSSVRYLFCSGEALSPEVFQSFKETFGKSLYNGWGAQEIGAPLCWRYGKEVPPEKACSVGNLVTPGTEVKLVDENGNEVPSGVPGEIMVKIEENNFVGYWHEPQGAALKFVEGWYKPGDSFMRDEDGYYWYRGRLDDMVKVAGRQVFPVEVEEAVARHPAVVEDAVIPVKNERGLTELQAFVVLKKGYGPSSELAVQIQNFVKEELAPFKRPGRVEFISALPKTANGKIQRFRLRELAVGQKKEGLILDTQA